MTCVGCPFNGRCPCGYSRNNAACLTIREQYAEEMTTKSAALYDKSMRLKNVKKDTTMKYVYVNDKNVKDILN